MGKKNCPCLSKLQRNKTQHVYSVSFHPKTYGLTQLCFVRIFYKFGFCSNVKLK